MLTNVLNVLVAKFGDEVRIEDLVTLERAVVTVSGNRYVVTGEGQVQRMENVGATEVWLEQVIAEDLAKIKAQDQPTAFDHLDRLTAMVRSPEKWQLNRQDVEALRWAVGSLRVQQDRVDREQWVQSVRRANAIISGWQSVGTEAGSTK